MHGAVEADPFRDTFVAMAAAGAIITQQAGFASVVVHRSEHSPWRLIYLAQAQGIIKQGSIMRQGGSCTSLY